MRYIHSIFISNLYNDYEAGLVYPCIEMQGITAPLHPDETINYDHGGMYSLSVMEGLPSASGMNYSLCVKLT
jgi:hypothetical protein